MNLFRQVLEELGRGKEIALATVLSTGDNLFEGLQILYNADGNSLYGREFAPVIGSVRTGMMEIETASGNIEMMIESFAPPPGVVIFGSGHIAKCLATLAKMLLYQVTVVDDRPEYTNRENFPEVDHIYCGSYEESLHQLSLHKNHYCVIVTRGHQTDAACLSQLLTKSVAYIGLVGSQRKVQSIWKLLQDQGVNPENYPHLYAPVGLDFHSETPQEIAFSIMGEIQMVRSGGTARSIAQLGHGKKVHPYADCRMRFDIELLRVMAEAMDERRPFAAITIIEAVGHVPRGVGSRAVIWEDGSIFRTVGGGRRENELITMALACLSTGKVLRKPIQFSGEYNDFEPVCGGRCTVFIQPYKFPHVYS